MAAKDTFGKHPLVESPLTSPGRQAFAIVPSDADELATVTRELRVGSGGDLVVVFVDQTQSVTLKNVADGERLPYRIKKVLATGTTATSIVGII